MELPDIVNPEEEESKEEDEKVPVDIETPNETVVIYADDNTPSCAADTIEELKERTEGMAERAVNWFTLNQMIVSADKTKLIYMGSKRNKENKIPEDFNSNIKVDKKEICHSNSEKLLGIIINDFLTWQNHLYGDSENAGLIITLGLLTEL